MRGKVRKRRVLWSVLLLALGAWPLCEVRAEDWVCQAPVLGSTPVCGELFDVAFERADEAVAVGEAGLILHAPSRGHHEANWVERRSGVRADLRGVVYGGNRWVVVGDNGTILTSSGAAARWEAVTSGVDVDLYSVAFGVGLYVAVGGELGKDGVVLTSTDGLSWTEQEVPEVDELRRVIHDGRFFVAVGGGGARLVSDDGVLWRKGRRNYPFTHLRGVASDGRTIVAVGQGSPLDDPFILTSTDGDVWTVRARGDVTLGDVVYRASGFTALGRDGETWESVDGETWASSVAADRQEIRAMSLVRDDSYVAVGARAFFYGDGDAYRESLLHGPGYYAFDGWRDVALTRFGFVAVGAGGVTALSSRDWVPEPFQTFERTLPALAAVARGGGTLPEILAVGPGGALFSSEDGRDWVEASLNVAGDFTGVAVGNGRAVAVAAAGRTATTEDGATWIADAGEPARNWNDVAFGAERFCAVGRNGATGASIDGGDWSVESVGLPVDLTAVSWAGDLFLAADEFGRAWGSVDCGAWMRFSTATVVPMFAAAGGRRASVLAGLGGVITSSRDLARWNVDESGTSATLRSVVFDGTNFLAVGDDGVVLSGHEQACGDALKNGRVTAADALEILKQSLRTPSSRDCRPVFCDTDGNGEITATDALFALRAAVGLADALGC